MSTAGQRKSALYLASLAPEDQRVLLAALPAASARALKPLVEQVVANGWNDPEVIGEVLADELRGLTADTSLSVEALLQLAKQLPPDWTARLFAANAALDARFMLALLDAPMGTRVGKHLAEVPKLPERLREAVLAEAQPRLAQAAR